MGSLDVDSFFTNISLKENIGICTNTLFFFKYEKSRMFKSKIELKKLSMPCYERILFCFVEISTTKSMELLWVQL